MIPQDKIVEIQNYLKKSENPLIFYDDDVDGLCSYLLFKKLKPHATGIILKLSRKEEERYLNKVREACPDYVFILDNPKLSQEFIEKINTPIIWIDHHKPFRKEKAHYYNPLEYDDKDNRSTSYWCYQVFKDICEEKDKDWGLWVGGIGCLSDYQIPDFLKEFKKFKLVKNKTIEKMLYEDKVGNMIKIFSFMLKGKMDEIKRSVDGLLNLENPEELLKGETNRSKYILERFENLNKDYKFLLDLALKNKKDNVFVFIAPSSKTSFTRDLSNELLYRVKCEVIIVGREKEDEVKMSLRSRNVNIANILKNALKEVRGYGGGHCLVGDSLIQLANGDIVKIEDINKNNDIIGMNLKEIKIVTGTIFKKFKIKKDIIYNIKTYPYNLKCSGDHTLFKFNNKIEEVKAKDLRKGDLIVGLKNLNIKGSKQKMPNLNDEKRYILSNYNQYKKIKIPKDFNAPFCKILGYVLGDGNIYNHDTFEIRDNYLELINHYKKLIEKTFEIKGKIRKIKNKNAFGYRIHSSLLAKLFEKIEDGWPYQKIIPSSIKKSKINEIKYFLKGIYDAEGSVGNHEVCISQYNNRFLTELQLLLLRLNIISNKGKRSLYISDFNSLNNFSKNISFSLKRKRIKLNNLIERLKHIKRNTKVGYALINSVELKEKLKYNNLSISKYFKHPERNLTLNNLNTICKKTGIKLKQLEYNFALFKINNIEKRDNKNILYDLTVPKTNNFIANGLLVHNSKACGAGIIKEDFDKFIEIIKKEVSA